MPGYTALPKQVLPILLTVLCETLYGASQQNFKNVPVHDPYHHEHHQQQFDYGDAAKSQQFSFSHHAASSHPLKTALLDSHSAHEHYFLHSSIQLSRSNTDNNNLRVLKIPNVFKDVQKQRRSRAELSQQASSSASSSPPSAAASDTLTIAPFLQFTLRNDTSHHHDTIKALVAKDLIINSGGKLIKRVYEYFHHENQFNHVDHDFHPGHYLWFEPGTDNYCSIYNGSVGFCEFPQHESHLQRYNETHYWFYKQCVMNTTHSIPILPKFDDNTVSRFKRSANEEDKTKQSQQPSILDGDDSDKRKPKCKNCICDLAIYVDAQFFKNYPSVKNDERATYQFVVTTLHNINKFYRTQVLLRDQPALANGSLPQEDANKNFWNATLGIHSLQFQMKYFHIHKEFTKHDNEKAEDVFYNTKWESRNGMKEWTVFNKLTRFARSHTRDDNDYNHGKMCLAHLLTYHDFDNGTIGLAYQAGKVSSEATNERIGICSKKLETISAYQNTALTTFKNFRKNIATAEAFLVAAHEIGHNLGAQHDCSLTGRAEQCMAAECRGDPEHGDWLMSKHAVSGHKGNNHLFSNCSQKNIRDVSKPKVSTCLRSAAKGRCGNYEVEEAEECDTGGPSSVFSVESDYCCTSKCRYNTTVNAVCSPRNHKCCKNSCKIYRNEEKQVCDNSDPCFQPVLCDGMKMCPTEIEGYDGSSRKESDDGTICRDGAGRCRAGKCYEYCEFIDSNAQKCLCNEKLNACKMCCQSVNHVDATNKTLGSCLPLDEFSKQSQLTVQQQISVDFSRDLEEGSYCNRTIYQDDGSYGGWEHGRCLIEVIDAKKKDGQKKEPRQKSKLVCQVQMQAAYTLDSVFSNLMDHISDGGFFKFVRRNIVGAIIMFSLLVWFPIAYIFHAADARQAEIHAKQNLAFEGMATFAMMHTVGMLTKPNFDANNVHMFSPDGTVGREGGAMSIDELSPIVEDNYSAQSNTNYVEEQATVTDKSFVDEDDLTLAVHLTDNGHQRDSVDREAELLNTYETNLRHPEAIDEGFGHGGLVEEQGLVEEDTVRRVMMGRPNDEMGSDPVLNEQLLVYKRNNSH